jgi:UDP-N-acetyl-D-mannosaminuronic acid dehydrogenase
MNVSVVGMGYIGLPTAAVLASKGIKVTGVDVKKEVVDIINDGRIHITEPGLDLLVQSAVKSKYLIASLEIRKADVFIIAVPTPFKGKNVPDLKYIKAAAKSISLVLEKGNLVILESTSPVGTTERIINWIKDERHDLSLPDLNSDKQPDISFAHCPERVLPGNILREIVENDRIIGGITTHCAIKAKEFYGNFVSGECHLTSSPTAELCKLVENSFRDVNIAFANELSLICNKLKIDEWELIELANRHPRVNILQPGPGVGGHCIAVDPWFIVHSAPNEAKLIRTARNVNDSKPNFVISKVTEAVNELDKDISKINIACLGLAFKPNIDDLRESPAINIAKEISSMGFLSINLVEPNISNLPRDFKQTSAKLSSLNNAIDCADIVLLLVDHDSFKKIDTRLLMGKKIIDTRGVWKL